MTFYVSTITFNHDTSSVNTSAMNIRRNREYEVIIPEYNLYYALFGIRSKAAYTIGETAKQPVSIQVEFRRSTSSSPAPIASESYEVRALGGDIMGNLDLVQVDFPPGINTVSLYIPLSHRNFTRVGKYECVWNWEYRLLGQEEWINMPSTRHTVYLVLRTPPSPWTQDFGSLHNPWTDLLDYSCTIASGTEEDHFSTMALTKAINSNYGLKYDILSGAPRYGYVYSGFQFNLSNWIDYVMDGNAPSYPIFCGGTDDQYRNYLIVNCYDNAAALTLMASVLGVDIEYNFHNRFGYLEYVEPIGRSRCNNPFYGCGNSSNAAVGEDDRRTGFGNHAYTKRGGDKNYDSTMRQYVSCGTKLTLIILIALIMLFTLGKGDPQWSLRNRINGWLINLEQDEYESYTIDTSASFEASAAGGVPLPQFMDFA